MSQQPAARDEQGLRERYSKPRQYDVRYVEDRFSTILRELARFRSYYVAWGAFDARGCVSYDDEAVANEFTNALKLGEAFYRQFRGSDDLVAPLPLYYGSMWFARAIINLYEYREDLGVGLERHGMSAKFPDLQVVDPGNYYDDLTSVLADTYINAAKGGRLSIFSQVLGGDDLSGAKLSVKELLASVPELDGVAEQRTRHARVFLRTDDYVRFDKERAMASEAGFDYRLDDDAAGGDDEFDREFALAPAFRDRNAFVSMRQVHFSLRGDKDEDDIRTLTLYTPQGLYLERRLRNGLYVPEPAVHLAIQLALSELVRYHPLTWLAMAEANTNEYALVREYMDISSRKYPTLILNELAWKTYDFRHF